MSACNWPVSYGGCDDGVMPEPLASMPASGVAMYEEMAVEYLWRWTGRTLGVCPTTVQPCREACPQTNTFRGRGPYTSLSTWGPVLVDGRWYNISCGGCGTYCGCGGAAPLRLPGPVQSVEGVLVDGVALPENVYHVENRRFLVRTDGARWPACGLEITYTRGTPVPIGGQVAAGLLAVEFAKAACGDDECTLPQRVQTVTRQGITVAVLDAFEDINEGHTGIWLVDSWVASLLHAPQPPAIYSPDQRPPARRRTWGS